MAIKWLHDLDAPRANKPVLVDFTAAPM